MIEDAHNTSIKESDIFEKANKFSEALLQFYKNNIDDFFEDELIEREVITFHINFLAKFTSSLLTSIIEAFNFDERLQHKLLVHYMDFLEHLMQKTLKTIKNEQD
jgi:hypothetical protein